MGAAKLELQFQNPVIVRLSEEERISGCMTEENVAMAVLGFHRDGVVILENAVDQQHCNTLNEAMTKEVYEVFNDPKTHFNDNVHAPPEQRSGNMQQRPPLRPELMYEDIWANKPAAMVLSAVLGPNPVCNFADGNTALGLGYKGRQAVHGDLAYNFPQGVPLAVCANYYLADASHANGSTELWLGSAKDSTFRDHKASRDLEHGDDPYNPIRVNLKNKDEAAMMITRFGVRDECLEKRREFAPPIQATVKVGSVMLRDLRTWHAGIANPSNKPRIMLAFIHTPWWYKCASRIYLPENTRELVELWGKRKQSPIVFRASYLRTENECRSIDFGVDFSSRNPSYWKMVPGDLAPGYTFSVE